MRAWSDRKGRGKHLHLLLGCTGKCLGFQRTLKGSGIGEDSGTQKPREGKGKEVIGVGETLIRKLTLQVGRLRPDPKVRVSLLSSGVRAATAARIV